MPRNSVSGSGRAYCWMNPSTYETLCLDQKRNEKISSHSKGNRPLHPRYATTSLINHIRTHTSRADSQSGEDAALRVVRSRCKRIDLVGILTAYIYVLAPAPSPRSEGKTRTNHSFGRLRGTSKETARRQRSGKREWWRRARGAGERALFLAGEVVNGGRGTVGCSSRQQRVRSSYLVPELGTCEEKAQTIRQPSTFSTNHRVLPSTYQ
jgi:hypothetical protein